MIFSEKSRAVQLYIDHPMEMLPYRSTLVTLQSYKVDSTLGCHGLRTFFSLGVAEKIEDIQFIAYQRKIIKK